jgi:hypothetical protein
MEKRWINKDCEGKGSAIMSRGIDYGLGQTNIDKETGIRFGVIHANEVCQAWSDSSESEYGEPSCPKCGNEAVASDAPIPEDEIQEEGDEDKARDELGYKSLHGVCGDYACDSCRILFDGDEAYGCESIAFNLDDGEYKATQGGDDCDIFILKSPYYTRAEFCSPCAPGACYLVNHTADGERAYCFGHDWFEDGVAPYPVFRVDDDSLVLPEGK